MHEGLANFYNKVYSCPYQLKPIKRKFLKICKVKVVENETKINKIFRIGPEIDSFREI